MPNIMNLNFILKDSRFTLSYREFRILILYSVAWSVFLFFCIPIVPDQSNSWYASVISFLLSVPLLFIVVLIFSVFLWTRSDIYRKLPSTLIQSRAKSIQIILIALLPCALIWGFYFFAFYPAIMNFDVINQWEQVTSKNFNDWHPVFHSLYLFFIQYLGSGKLSSVSAAQIIFLLAIFSYLIFVFQRIKISHAAIIGLTIYFAFFPLIGLYNMTLWKDTPFSFCMLLLTIFNIQIFLSNGKWLDSRTHRGFLIACLVGVALFRHNGILPAILFILSLLLICRSYWKIISTVTLTFFLVILVIKYPLYEVLNVPSHSKDKRILNSIPCIYTIGSIVTAGRTISSEEENILTGFMPMATWRDKYNPQDVVSLVWHAKPDWKYLASKSESKKFRLTCTHLILRNLDMVWNNFLQVGSYEWRIRELPSDTYSYVIEYDSDPNILYIMPNDMGIKAVPLLPSFHKLIIDSIFFPIKGKYSKSFP